MSEKKLEETLKAKRAYEIALAIEKAEADDNPDLQERLCQVKWVQLCAVQAENQKLVDGFPLELFENRTLEQCNAIRSLFNKLLGIDFRPYLRCTRITKNCVTCEFLKQCQELNPTLKLGA